MIPRNAAERARAESWCADLSVMALRVCLSSAGRYMMMPTPGVQAVRLASRGDRAHVGGAGRGPALLDGRGRGRPVGLQLLHELPHEAQIRAIGVPAGSHSTAWCSNIWVMKRRSTAFRRLQAVT